MMWSHTCGIVAVSAFLVVCQLRAVQPHTSRTPEKFQNVEALVQQGRLADAKTAMLDELQRNPSSIDGYNLLGIIDSDEQDYSSALAAFQKALKLAPNSTKTHVNLGNVYVAQKRPDLAEKEFRAVLRFDPANQDGNYNLGVLLMARKAAAEAIPHFERVHPSTLPVRLNLIHALFQAKRAAEALRMATALSAQNKNDVQVRFSLGLLLASEGQYKPAQLELEEADVLQPGTFEIIYNLGQASLRDGNNAAAELSLTRALKLKPDSPDALYLLAQVFASESRPRDALELLVRAHKLAPENTDVIYLMAEVSMSQNFYEDAVPVLESGLQIAPQRSDLRAALGKSYFMAGKVDQAIEVFKKLTEVDRSARPYALLGVAYRQLGRYDEAKQSLQNGLALDPRDASCLFNLGLIEEQQGDSAGAESMLQQVLRSSPSFPDALLELANLRIAAKKLPDAEQLLRKYVRLSPNPATGYYKLAIVERSLHETAAADRDLSVFQTLSKDVSNAPITLNTFSTTWILVRSWLPTPAIKSIWTRSGITSRRIPAAQMIYIC
jgi:tetratricopeptide (TPR) repeat protein